MAEFTDQHEQLLNALLSRRAGFAKAPSNGIGEGSGLKKPEDLTHPDPAVARNARHLYTSALMDRGMERLSKEERAIVLEECNAVLKDDGYYTG